MFFEYDSGYQVSDLFRQIRSERNVARAMGLRWRSVMLERMENLVCHFYGCNFYGAPVIEPTNGMEPSIIKMKMANEARKILSALEKSGLETENESVTEGLQRSAKNKTSQKKIYKYPCHVRVI